MGREAKNKHLENQVKMGKKNEWGKKMVKPSTSSSPHILLLLLMLLLVPSISLASNIFISLASSMLNIGCKEQCTGYSSDFLFSYNSCYSPL